MLDALSFALFGKAHRNINKNQLVNSINNKGMVVEVMFNVAGSEYKIVRGIKPNIFEIWKDNVMINQDSHAKEYQKILEQNIIKLNHKSFHQIVVLGSSSFIPFMQLPANTRREVIEDLLDINVFSKMNSLLKEQVARLKDNIRDNSLQIELISNKVSTQQKYIKDIERINNVQRGSKEKEIENLHEEIAAAEKERDNGDEERLLELKELLNQQISKRDEIGNYIFNFKTQMKVVAKNAKFYEDNASCPTCEQDIDLELKSNKLSEARKKAIELKTGVEKAEELLASNHDIKIKNLQEKIEECSNVIAQCNARNRQISQWQRQVTSIQKEIEEINAGVGDLSVAQNTLNQYNDQYSKALDLKYTLNEDFSYSQVAAELLKDTGIKTKIIKQYLPVINKLTNKYLQVLDFYISFDLDESFKETIRSRHRDEFSYDSFSEGEKQRIDLSLLFTWRMVAKMKNSVATNLLILDETFDSSLDADGVENLMKILDTLDADTNVLIISHKGELLDEKFDRKIEFVKVKNFSKAV
jgi:DNA repair exonuclease SbcCD ATPase subunit